MTSPSPTEPEKYSIDQMVERLKTPVKSESGDTGELVTRADGTQAVRVRKRKRRSEQPKKEAAKRQRKMRVIQASAALALLLVLLLAAAGVFVYANTSHFRDKLVSKASASVGADVEFIHFRVSPAGAKAGNLNVTWPEGNALASLQLHDLQADISPTSFLGATWHGKEAKAAEGTLTLRVPKAGLPRSSESTSAGSSLVSFTRCWVPKLNVILGEGNNHSLKLTNTEASLYPRNDAGVPELLLRKGNMAIPNWPQLRLDRALMEFSGTTAKIARMRLLHESDDRGTLEFTGTADLSGPGGSSKLVPRLKAFKTSGLLGSSFETLINGRIDSRDLENGNSLTIVSDPDPSAELSVAFQSVGNVPLEAGGFPFFEAFARAFADEWFSSPTFESSATGVLSRVHGAIALSDLEFKSAARMTLKGDLKVSPSGEISGSYRVGVRNAVIAASTVPGMESVFSEERDSLRWVTITLSGTLEQPRDNFSALLSGAPAAPAKREAIAPGDDFDELTRPR